jgi:hypothetical protein
MRKYLWSDIQRTYTMKCWTFTGKGNMSGSSLLEWIVYSGRLQVLSVACELELFDRLAEEAQSAESLATQTGAQLAPLRALLDACVGMDLLSLDKGLYRNRATAQSYLVGGSAQYLGELIHIFSVEAPQWFGLRDLVMEGRAPEDSIGVETQRFTMGMHALGMLGEAEALASQVSLEGRRELIDVGCGSGIYAITLCQNNPGLQATLLDREKVLQTTARIVARSPCADRLTLRPADIFEEEYGEGKDAVLFSDVLYADVSICRRMIGLAHNALKPGGLLIVRGYFSDPDGVQSSFGALFDLKRMLWDPSRAPITIQVLKGWIADAGFQGIRTFALTERSTALLGEKA